MWAWRALLVGEQFETAGDSGGVGSLEGDGDPFGVVQRWLLIGKRVSVGGPVFVKVAEMDVEVFGEPGLGVERQESQHHLQATALYALLGPLGVGVHVGSRYLGGYGAHHGLGLVEGGGGYFDASVCGG